MIIEENLKTAFSEEFLKRSTHGMEKELPNFFKTAQSEYINRANLQFAKNAYFDLPLPYIFKEKVFVHLSKFFENKYCLIRHFTNLVGAGQFTFYSTGKSLSLDEGIKFVKLEENKQTINSAKKLLFNLTEKIELNHSLSPELEDALCLVLSDYFHNQESQTYAYNILEDVLYEKDLECIFSLLSFITFSKQFLALHPHIKLEQDTLDFFEQHPEAKELLNSTFRIGVQTELAQKFNKLALKNLKLIQKNNSILKEEQKWQKILNISGIGAFELDLRTDQSWRSYRHDQIFGYEEIQDDWGIERFLTHVKKSHQKEVSDQFAKAVKTKSTWEFTCPITNAKGQNKWIKAIGKVTEVSSSGEPLAMYGAVEDITSYKEIEISLKKATHAAQAANITKSEFLRNMSHEIRTPMNAILGFSELLNENDFDHKSKKEFVDSIIYNGQHLMTLINDVLNYSKLENGIQSVSFSEINIKTLVESSIKALDSLAKKNNTKVNVDLKSVVSFKIHSSPTLMRQVIYNLVSNAIKFTKNGTVNVQLNSCNDLIEIRVQDTGVGIREDYQDQIFDEFSQSDTSATRDYGGTGIGLALSKSLIQSLDGDLILEKSVLGEGSTFLLSVPLRASEDVQSKVNKTEKEPDSKKLKNARILLAEDSKENYRVIYHFLNSEEMEIDWAKNGEEAVQKAVTNEYDLVLMDIQMPVMDGYTATRIIKKIYPDLPVLALTAHALPTEIETSEQQGCDGHLTKPIAKQKLIQSLAHYL
ncbi:MAG: hypothetical protein CME62_00335 [Halobacteriovoraceae bacterium]|nr:hypothetical protein [Halobacteriovoraceae bacterium]|tara:strand:+ start:4975 stop:7248 length:2274 start_codon:yes stop_codon:yes gene_type:complete